jgi:hypothetical protein
VNKLALRYHVNPARTRENKSKAMSVHRAIAVAMMRKGECRRDEDRAAPCGRRWR